MKTIIQTIGPLYGEIVNGTVFGQPNGSEARPNPNSPPTILLSGDAGKLTYIQTVSSNAFYSITGVSAAYSNLSEELRTEFRVFNSSDELVARYKKLDGVFTGPSSKIPTDGDSLTIVGMILDVNSVKIAESTLTITAVVSS